MKAPALLDVAGLALLTAAAFALALPAGLAAGASHAWHWPGT